MEAIYSCACLRYTLNEHLRIISLLSGQPSDIVGSKHIALDSTCEGEGSHKAVQDSLAALRAVAQQLTNDGKGEALSCAQKPNHSCYITILRSATCELHAFPGMPCTQTTQDCEQQALQTAPAPT